MKWQIITKFGVYRQVILKVHNTTFHGNLSSVSRAEASRQMDRCTDGQMYRWTDGQMYRWEDGQMGRCTDGQMDRWTDVQMDRWADGQMYRWTDGQMDRCTDRETGVTNLIGVFSEYANAPETTVRLILVNRP
jgi:hypothetical protein